MNRPPIAMPVARLDAPRRPATLRDEPLPTPADGEVLLRVTGVGLCGSDRHWFEDGSIGGTSIERPLVLGHEFVGVVPDGDRVRASGSWRIPADAVRDLHDLRERAGRALPDGRVRRVSGDRRGVASVRDLAEPPAADPAERDRRRRGDPARTARDRPPRRPPRRGDARVEGRRRRRRPDRPADHPGPASRGRGRHRGRGAAGRIDSTSPWPPGRGRSARTTRSTWRSRWPARTRRWISRSPGPDQEAGWSSSASRATTEPPSRHLWPDARG